MVAVCCTFFQYAISNGLTEINPFMAVKANPIYQQHQASNVESRSLTQIQWLYVIETAEIMAAEDPRHERTLFLVATLFALYLRVSDLAGRGPTMGDIRRDTRGNWWFHVRNSNGEEEKISLRDEYVQAYLTRYRLYIKLPPLPSIGEQTPLISTLKGRAGLSDRHIRLLLQDVFDRALARMAQEGWDDEKIDQLRSASLHWLRYTSAKIDASHRNVWDLQADLRLKSQNPYYTVSDEQRAHSVRGLKLKN
jgi:site-specific recombinase XerD